jgi:hypothetical protein
MRTLYSWTRDLHLYLGLAIGPLVLVFAASVLILNHPPAETASSPAASASAAVRIPEGIEKMEGMARAAAAQEILAQLGVHAEIGWVSYSAKRGVLTLPVTRPGRQGTVRVSLPERRATVEWGPWRFADAVNWFHKLPGPHLTNIRGNWLLTRVWRVLADWLVYLLLFVTASGIYLWAAVRAARRTGLVLLGLGAVSFWGVIYALL